MLDARVTGHASPPQLVRQVLGRAPRIRSGVYLGASVWAAARDTAGHRRRYSLATYTSGDDPWSYTSERGSRHLAAIEELVVEVAGNGDVVHEALDLGCGDGWAAERVAAHVPRVVAVDVSPEAVEQVRRRSANIDGQVRDVVRDGLPAAFRSRFDLVLALGLFEVFQQPSHARKVRRLVLDALRPGGYLIVANVRQHPVVEQARWAAWLPRGASGIDRFLRAAGHVELRRSVRTDTHLLTVYRAT